MQTLSTWLDANHEGLIIGLAVGVGLVAVMLLLRGFGQRSVQ